jgi:DNA-binding CsgD family transcriptional regulator
MTGVKLAFRGGTPPAHQARPIQITVLDGNSLRVSVPTAAQRAARAPELTPAERDVIAHALAGFTNLHIARLRGSALRTVANQLASAYRKLGLSGRRELAARAP